MVDIFEKDESGKLRFRPRFDELYSKNADPWFQSGISSEDGGKMAAYYAHSRKRLFSTVAYAMGYNTVYDGLEVGCGHGHVTHAFGIYAGGGWSGLDISRVAIERAKQLYPGIRFTQGDITQMAGAREWNNVVVLNQVLWYILHNLEGAFDSCYCLLNRRGMLVISQAFLRDQQYGTEIINGFNGLIHYLLLNQHDKFDLVMCNYDVTEEFVHHDGLVVLQRKG